MKTCPYCKREIPLEARECKFCRQVVVRACPYCAEEIFVTAKVCRYCSSDLSDPPRTAASAPPGMAAGLRALGPVCEERNIVVWVIVTLVTCGIGNFIWLYNMGCDLNGHGGRERLRPGLDILLTFVTCGLWALYVYYTYAKTLQDIVQEEGGRTQNDLPVICLLVGFFVPLVATALIQNELNQHWRAHGLTPPYTQGRASA